MVRILTRHYVVCSLTKKPAITRSACLQSVPYTALRQDECIVCRARPSCHYIYQQHVCITYYLYIQRMNLLPIHVGKFILCRCPYSNMSAVNGADYIRETGHCCKLRFYVGLLSHSVRKSYVTTTHINYAVQNGRQERAQGLLRYPRPKDRIDQNSNISKREL